MFPVFVPIIFSTGFILGVSTLSVIFFDTSLIFSPFLEAFAVSKEYFWGSTNLLEDASIVPNLSTPFNEFTILLALFIP